MYYIIQENLFKEKHYQLLIDAMERYGLEYEIVKFRPFVHDIEFTTQRKDIFCFGAVAMAAAAKKYNWNPGSMLNDNHDFNVYDNQYGAENMLNGDGYIIDFTDPLPIADEAFFARPIKDSKVFSGQVFSQTAWKAYAQISKDIDTVNTITEDTKILVAPLKHIQQEVRCWVVGGKVVTASRYKLGNKAIYANYDDASFFVDFAQKMVDIFAVAEAFVIDVCLVNDALKVVEVNNINSAGFYACTMEKLITALEAHFKQT
jgi:ATP-grasp domain, R2K clade family 3